MGREVPVGVTRVNSGKVHLDLSGLASGVYFIKLISNGQMTSRKLVVE
jgi:hypothetical protein